MDLVIDQNLGVLVVDDSTIVDSDVKQGSLDGNQGRVHDIDCQCEQCLSDFG